MHCWSGATGATHCACCCFQAKIKNVESDIPLELCAVYNNTFFYYSGHKDHSFCIVELNVIKMLGHQELSFVFESFRVSVSSV